MRTITSINGKFVTGSDARISVFDNALLYAEGLFETMLGIGERLVFLDEHLDRLERGADVIGLTIPVKRELIVRWLKSAARAHPAQIKKVRLTVTSGESARWTSKAGMPQVIVTAAPHEIPVKPYRLYLSDLRVDQRSVFRRIKTLSYSIHAAALRQAKARRCDDALLLNEAGRLAEVTSANLFWVKQNRVHTPPLSAGCLAGVTRDAVIRELRTLGLKVIESAGRLDTLTSADEVFISSSLKLVIGVSRIVSDEQTIDVPRGRVTRILSRHFQCQLGLLKRIARRPPAA